MSTPKNTRTATASDPDYAERLRAANPSLTIIESPYRGTDLIDRRVNELYLTLCMRDSIERGEAPIASHALYTRPGLLDEDKPDERALGIALGLAWWRARDQLSGLRPLIVFYQDRGWSNGMKAALERASEHGIAVTCRNIGMAQLAKLADAEALLRKGLVR